MNLLEMLMSAGGNAAVGQLGSRFGLDENQTMAALQQLVPALGGGLQRNISAEGGLDNLLGALSGETLLAGALREQFAVEHVETDLLDLSRVASDPMRHIHPCKGCVSTAMPLCHWPS